MNFRWAGDANIAIAIEPSIAGTTLRMVPRVSDLRVRTKPVKSLCT